MTATVDGWGNSKQCSKCKRYLSLSKFYKNKAYKGGYKSECKDCSNEYHRDYCQKNRDKIREHNREYNQRNKDKKREYRRKNKDKLREYRVKNRDKYRECSAKQRGLGWFPLFENFLPSNIKVDNHHCNYFVVVPIPYYIHKKFSVNRYTNHQYHIDKCNQWIKKYYSIDIDKILSPL